VNAGLPGNSSGLVPSVAESFDRKPTSFGPRVPDPGQAPKQKQVTFQRGLDGKLIGAQITEVGA
jgi:hypothetical protein